MKSRFRTSLQFLCALGMGLIASASAAIAQNNWESFYSPSFHTTAARGGVLHFSDNSSIAVGETKSAGGTYDIYVTHQGSNNCYVPDWQYTYNIGGNDIGRKIRKTSDGGYIIVGTTDNTGTGCNANNIFLLKLNNAGGVSWAFTYGGSAVDEGRDVQQLSNGDYVVVGSTYSAGFGGRDAYMMRVGPTGSPLWGKTYGSSGDDYFLSVEIASNGELIASGGTTYNSFGGTDILMGRFSPTTGNAVYYYNYGTLSNEGAWRAIPLTNGNIAICGYTRGFGGSAEGTILLTNSSGALLTSRYYGGNTGGWDEFLDITQLVNGNLAVTGLFYNPAGGFGGYDIYVASVNPTTLVPTAQLLFGNEGDDQGWAITRSGNGGADGWMVAGLSNSRYTGNLENMYVISRPNMNRRFCQDTIPYTINGSATYSSSTYPPPSTVYILACSVSVTRLERDDFIPGCGDCGTLQPGRPNSKGISEYRGPAVPARIAPAIDSANLSVSSVDERSGISAALYPNPVRSGNSFTIGIPAGSLVTEITVSDISGKVVYSGTANGIQATIGTGGWAGGIYAVSLKSGDRSETRRIVVTE